jgi:hypothetical protein
VTPDEYEYMARLGLGAEALELWTQREQPGHEQRNAEFSAAHSAADVVAGLLVIGEYFGLSHLGPDDYPRTLAAFQRAAEVADAVAPVAMETDDRGHG